MQNRQTGFTLVELVVVILILGILAATALPRFMNVNTQAHQAAVAGAAGGLGAGIALARAQWFANGATASADNVTNFGDGTVDMSATGWPTDTAGNNSIAAGAATQCVSVWTGVMQNPPTAATAAGSDYLVTAPSAENCLFTYQRDTANVRTIGYNSTSGAITITNP